jgi:signal transduction histidine kinase
MFNLLRKSLQRRILAAFLLVGILPYLFILTYFTYWGHESITQQQANRYIQQTQQSKLLIQNHLQQLSHEVNFLSRLEIFDDMITGDLDHRISRLLEQKINPSDTTALKLLALDQNGEVIAASQASLLNNHFNISPLLDTQNPTIIEDKFIILKRLYSSFDKRALGYLMAEYPLENLKRFMIHGDNFQALIMSDQHILIGEKIKKGHQLYRSEFVGILKGYTLVYAVNEDELLIFIRQFILYLSLLLLVGIAVIIYSSRKLSSQIVQPITSLTQAAESIIKTKNYNLRVASENIDETGSLATMFNALIKTTQEAFHTLDQENQIRMQRFIDLTDMFNHITQTHNKEACIKISIEKLQTIIPYSIHFEDSSYDTPSQSLHVKMLQTDLMTHEQLLYGFLVIDKEHFSDGIEKRFFDSVAAMIMLQIERIELIGKIRSASEAKSTFISGMSHELRTPLNAIIGFSQYLITYETLSDEQIDTMGKIEKAAMHLLSMINEILDIAKIEAGKIELTCKETLLIPQLEDCIEILQPLAEEKNIIMTLERHVEEDFIFYTDAKLLKQIIINLLSNAIKFTDKGSIRLHVSEENQKLHIHVIDTGIGISKEDLSRVFDEFTQLNNSKMRKAKGTGLGLSLSRHIALSLGGSLTLQSEGLHQGTQANLIFKIR